MFKRQGRNGFYRVAPGVHACARVSAGSCTKEQSGGQAAELRTLGLLRAIVTIRGCFLCPY